MKNLSKVLFSFLAIVAIAGVLSAFSANKENVAGTESSVVVNIKTFVFTGDPGQENDITKWVEGSGSCNPTGNRACTATFDFDKISLATAVAAMPAGPYTDGQTYSAGTSPNNTTVTIRTKVL